MLKLHLLLLLAALLVGAGLRISGITWGLPDGVHAGYSYHPDETSLLEWASDLYRGAIMSKQFIYGGTFYFSTLEAGSRVADGLSTAPRASLRERLLVTRMASVLWALLTIVVVYQAGATLFTPMVGAWAALVLALAPGHLIAAQVSRPDALFTLLLGLNLWCAARVSQGRGRVDLNLIAAGVVLGVAVATRFPAALWSLGHGAALWMAARDARLPARSWLSSCGALGAVALLAYLIASPHSLMYFPVLLDGLATQFNYQRGGEAAALAGGVGGWRYGGRVMAEALGYGAYLPAWLAVLYAAWRRSRADALLALFALPYFLALTSTHWVVVRYFVPLLPILAIWLGVLLHDGLCAGRVPRAVTLALALCALTVNALAVGLYGAALRAPDTRDRALQWLVKEVPAGASIGVLQAYEGDVFFHPPAIAHFRWSACALDRCDVAEFFQRPFDVLVIADIHLDAVNAAGHRSQVAHALAAQTGFEPVARFAPPLAWRGYDITPQFRVPDVRDALTTLIVYRPRAAGEVARQGAN